MMEGESGEQVGGELESVTSSARLLGGFPFTSTFNLCAEH